MRRIMTNVAGQKEVQEISYDALCALLDENGYAKERVIGEVLARGQVAILHHVLDSGKVLNVWFEDN